MRVFVSSASDMGDEREEAINAIRVAWELHPRAMEDWSAGVKSPLGKIYEEIRLSDFFILLLGARYGGSGPGSAETSLIPGATASNDFSYVRAEYNYARECRKPILALLSDATYRKEAEPSQSDEDTRLQDEFRSEVRNSLITKTWRDRADIAAYVMSSLLRQNKATGKRPRLFRQMLI